MKDTFDFTEFCEIYENNKFNFGNLANDFGLSLQIADLLTPYDWQVSFTYYF